MQMATVKIHLILPGLSFLASFEKLSFQLVYVSALNISELQALGPPNRFLRFSDFS